MKKGELRKLYLEKRKALTSEEVQKRSESITQQFFTNIDLSKINYLHIFIPIHKFNEFDSWKIIHKIWKEYPHIQTVTSITDTKSDYLQHYVFNKNTNLAINSWGIHEPTNGTPIEANLIDMVITPLLCIDTNNNRIGYGKGYYDRFFSECKPTVQKIGISLFPPLNFEIEDTNEFDIPLDSCLIGV